MMMSLQSGCTCQDVCVLHWPMAWIWWESNSRFVCCIIKAVGHESTYMYFNQTKVLMGVGTIGIFGLLIGLWPESNWNVHHWLNLNQGWNHMESLSYAPILLVAEPWPLVFEQQMQLLQTHRQTDKHTDRHTHRHSLIQISVQLNTQSLSDPFSFTHQIYVTFHQFTSLYGLWEWNQTQSKGKWPGHAYIQSWSVWRRNVMSVDASLVE